MGRKIREHMIDDRVVFYVLINEFVISGVEKNERRTFYEIINVGGII